MCENIYEINVDKLFETHSIPEIDQIQKVIQNEVEKKREELRTMVGERYRDLLKAADTIEIMKETSTSIVTQIGQITEHCKNLNEKQLIGFKTEIQLQNKDLYQYFGTVFQIKLLTKLPEMIWSHIDNNCYFLATQLFIFSRHISSGLQLSIDNDYVKYFGVAKKQWEILKPFHSTLKQVSTNALEKEPLSAKLACDCLLSIFLLDKNSLENILNIFLHLRTKAYLSTLCGSDKANKKRVKDRILASLQVLNSTVDLIEKCFIGEISSDSKHILMDSEKLNGLLFQNLEKLSDTSSKPTINLMDLDDTDVIHVLPDIILNFKPSFPTPVLDIDVIRQKVENWYLSISNVANSQLKNLFDLVSSMKTLQEIQKQSLESEISSSNNNSKFNEVLSLSTVTTLYKKIYKPLLNARACEIIRNCWLDCLNLTCNEINQFIEKSQLNSNTMDDNDDGQLWIDCKNDLPFNMKTTSSSLIYECKKQNKLLMKIKGYNNEIIKICSNFDERLEAILKDLDFFLSEENNVDNSDEKEKLVEFIRDISKENAYKFIENMKKQEIDKKLENFILVARLLSALIELCPNFKLCLIYTHTKKSWEMENDKIWYQICKLFEEESFNYWKYFCDKFFEQFPSEKWITDNLEFHHILSDFLCWDTISIEEQDEHNNPLQSTIKIPSQIRISLQTYFFELMTLLNIYVPQTLPQKVLNYFNSILIRNLLERYENLLKKQFPLRNQNVSLQIYFDLKFLQMVFIKRENKKEHETFQKLTNILKEHIDPFDFELFHKHLNNNVKKCALRLQHQLGLIIPYPENITGDIKQLMVAQEKDPNVLCISCNGSSATWFSLLPIVVPGKLNNPQTISMDTEKQLKKQETINNDQQQYTSQNYAQNYARGAAAFFGAMSQDWFR